MIIGLLVALMVIIVFLWQNPTPLALVVLNVKLPMLWPLGAWVLLFFGAGLFTSLLWQLGTPTKRASRPASAPTKPKRDAPPPADATDWDRPPTVQWDETQPEVWDEWRSAPQKRDTPPRSPQPKPPSPQRSPAPDGVYDADYRLIDPPTPPPSDPSRSLEEEEWI